jgi:hypothetical protein
MMSWNTEPVAAPFAQTSEVGAGAKISTCAPQHRDLGFFVGVECEKRFDECITSRTVDCVAHIRPFENDGRDISTAFDTYIFRAHSGLPQIFAKLVTGKGQGPTMSQSFVPECLESSEIGTKPARPTPLSKVFP